MRARISWPTAAVLLAGVVFLAVAFLAGPSVGIPEDSYKAIVSAVGALFLILLAAMRSLFLGDDDNDGRENWRDSTPDGEETETK